MNKAPRGVRPHIAFFGRRNVGKSSFLNAVTRQKVAIVSDVAGTTTDPVEKPMEFLPLGPVVFIDTAGVDDVGELGEARIGRTWKVLDRTDLAILVADAATWGDVEVELLDRFAARNVPAIVVLNKCDVAAPSDQARRDAERFSLPVVEASATTGTGLNTFRRMLLETMPEGKLADPVIVGDLIEPGDLVVLVVPIDMEAPKGRIILPQVQTIRDILDHDAATMVVKENELPRMFDLLKKPPALVVTDSQAFEQVARDTPDDVALTSFSILFSRMKGDLTAFVEGALAIDNLKPGSRVLIAEACTHHPIGEDIGRVKLPRWLNSYVDGDLQIDVVSGSDFPADISPYELVLHCGSCMFNPQHLMSRVLQCREQKMPVTNYGVAIAHIHGILPRAVAMFPEAHALLTKKNG
jgi:[FeFe] hydrogenase H-cluster maturation GTPase HydF